MDVLCHLTGLHFPSPVYYSSQNVSLTALGEEGRQGERKTGEEGEKFKRK